MTRKKLYMLIQTVLCVLVFLLLSLAAVRIYCEGARLREAGDYLTWVYTREKAAEKFGPISPLFFGAIGFMIAGFVLGMKDDRLDKPVPDAEVMRNLYSRKVPVPTPQMSAERVKQKKLRIIGIIMAIVCAVPVLLYMANPNHFDGSSPKQVEEAFLTMLLHILPWIAIAFGCLCVTESLREKSIDREAGIAKDAMKAQSRERADAEDTMKAQSRERVDAEDAAAPLLKKENHRAVNVVRVVVFVTALILIIHGINNGSMQDVLVKATNICTECIGLG